MRKLITVLLLLAAFGVYASTQWTLNRNDATNGTPIVETFTVDTLRHEKVGPGTMYTLVYLHGDGLSTHMRAHFLTFDMKNHDDVQFRMELGNDSLLTVETPSSIAIRKNAPGNYYYASCNADFYITWDPYIGNRPSLLVKRHGLIKSSLPSFCGIWKTSCSSLCAVPL